MKLVGGPVSCDVSALRAFGTADAKPIRQFGEWGRVVLILQGRLLPPDALQRVIARRSA
jgi:hypothetical protein